MLGDYGEVYVLDWGIAKVLTGPAKPSSSASELSEEAVQAPNLGPLTGMHHILGTRAYASPEQARGLNNLIDARTDVFSLGAILFEILTWQQLRPPAAARRNTPESDTLVNEPGDPRPSVRAPGLGITPELEAICVRATQLEKDARYPSVRALLNDLEKTLSGERAVELRQQLAEGHAKAAAAAARESLQSGELGAKARQVALREAGRAVGIDSQSVLALGTLQRLISRPSSQLPAPVQQALARSLRLRERLRLRGLALASVILLLLTLALPLGHVVRSVSQMVILGTTAVCSSGLWILLALRPQSPRTLHYVGHTLNLVLYALIARLLGPLWLATVPLTMNAFLQAATPDTRFRRFVIGSSCSLLLLMVALEMFGVLLTVHSPVIELAPLPLLLMLTIGSFLLITVPALGIGQLTTRLAKTERQLRLRAWHLDQILPEGISPPSPSTTETPSPKP